jgi:DNA mismatch endonuclease (patch repair protein)
MKKVRRQRAASATSPRAPSYKGLRPASEAASRAKRSNRKHNTMPEVLLRHAVWRLGLRYRKNVPDLPGVPDLVFRAAAVVVFCDGDFWHGRSWPRLRAKLARGVNAAYWSAKIAHNRRRDQATTAVLEDKGWRVLRLWETDVKRNPAAAARRIRRVVEARLRRAALGRLRPPRP